MPILTDGVLTLRPPSAEDVDALVEACQDPEISRWTRVPQPYVRADALTYLARTAEETRAGRTRPFLGFIDEALVGSFSVMELGHTPGYGELGYWVAAPARGRGVATRAVTLLRDWAVAALGLARIELLIHEDNAPSIRVAELTGFIATGELRTAPREEDPGPPRYRVFAWSAD
jgi:RimJ/RimL family protein N-acetyltransferase